MPCAANSLPAIRLILRPRQVPLRPSNAVVGVKRPACQLRTFADDKSKGLPSASAAEAKVNAQPQEHVSEEAAKMAKITGGQGPDIEGQGTPVQEILRDEKELRDQAPKVMQDQAKTGATTKPSSGRSFSTLARRQLEAVPTSSNIDTSLDPSMLPTGKQQAQYAAELSVSSSPPAKSLPPGLKFPMPDVLPRAPSDFHKDYRYHPIVEQVTNLIMKDGKKSVAQRYMATILTILRTSSPPTYNPNRQLMPGAPPAQHLPLNPVLYLTLAIDSVAPLLRIRSQRGAAGGGVALQIPVPLGLRQRRRTAFQWILDAAVKRKSRGSGKDMFPQKVAEELIAVVEGRSGVWEKRGSVHKLGTTARSNLNAVLAGGRKR